MSRGRPESLTDVGQGDIDECQVDGKEEGRHCHDGQHQAWTPDRRTHERRLRFAYEFASCSQGSQAGPG